MDQLTIAAVAKLTGIPAHTLRKWESRHGIAIPNRTDSGRRVYDMTQVEQLRLIRLLTESGHSLAQLALLDMPALQDLAQRHNLKEEPAQQIRALLVVGYNLTQLALAEDLFEDIERVAQPGEAWLAHPTRVDAEVAIAIELATLSAASVDQLINLRRNGFREVIVVYDFANRTNLRHLEIAGVHALRGPVSAEYLFSTLHVASPPPPPRPQRDEARFSPAQLAEIANMTPSLQCECPNHIASLLMNITAFENYCRECEDSDPRERALHAHLAELTAAARNLFEEGLVAVAKADNLDLNDFNAAPESVS